MRAKTREEIKKIVKKELEWSRIIPVSCEGVYDYKDINIIVQMMLDYFGLTLVETPKRERLECLLDENAWVQAGHEKKRRENERTRPR